MKTSTAQIISLKEYQKVVLPKVDLTEEQGAAVWQGYSSQVSVEFPCPKTNQQWELTSQGWVGQIPVDINLMLILLPKVEIRTIFGMLEYAYRLKSFKLLHGITALDSLDECYEELALILAKRILDRVRKGVLRTYVSRRSQLPYVRGRIMLDQQIAQPWNVELSCQYHEHSADIEDNQILLWTFKGILQSNACTESRSRPFVRRAFRALTGKVELRPFQAQSCIGRMYHRLNEDYRPLHGICRFFLEQSGPSHNVGNREMLPFIVNMGRLFELFVTEWLRTHLPSNLSLHAQERVDLDADSNLHFNIDLVLQDIKSGSVICVLDTKYKVPQTASTDDIAKIVAYAESQGCDDAYLVYPEQLVHPLNIQIGGKRVRSLTFGLADDLEAAGNSFLTELLAILTGVTNEITTGQP